LLTNFNLDYLLTLRGLVIVFILKNVSENYSFVEYVEKTLFFILYI